jgi:hypothetical protein
MQLHFFTIPIHDDAQVAAELNRFLAGHKVIEVERCLVQDGRNSAWTVCVSIDQGGGETSAPTGRRSRVDYKEVLDESDFALYSPCFRERVLHHALMAQVGPVLDRALVDDSYACRVGKGTLAAVLRVQQHLRRWPWYAQIDIRGYFANIDHERLRDLLARRFKNPGLLALMAGIIDSYHTRPGRGLPLGELTSQHLANYYLNGLDRLLLEDCRVNGLVRYMDDLLWSSATSAVNSSSVIGDIA